MSEEKIAPVQGYSAGIPWSMHLRAYDAYCKMYGPQQALIDLEGRNCRGGFSVGELDMFIPGWRDELSEITRLREYIAELEIQASRLRQAYSDDLSELEDLRDCKELLRELGRHCVCDHVESSDERAVQVQHIEEAFDALKCEIRVLKSAKEK